MAPCGGYGGVSKRVSDAEPQCALSVVVLNRTTSGGHMFKLRDVVVFLRANPCEDAFHTLKHLMKARNGLECVHHKG